MVIGLKKQMPPMCAENGLKKEPIKSDDLKLTELERSMIALRIPFSKIVMLPKTRLVCLRVMSGYDFFLTAVY